MFFITFAPFNHRSKKVRFVLIFGTFRFADYTFFGIQYKLSKNFSIATEPGFFLKYNIRRDRRSFDPNAQSDTWESRLAKIGVVQVNFHF